MKVYRIIAPIVAWTGLVLMFIVMTADKSGPQLVRAITNYFSYFTILSNIFVALSFTLAWLGPESGPGRFFARPAVRTGIALYIAVTGLVYWLILSPGLHPTGMKRFATTVLHLVVPFLYVADWIILFPKGDLKWRHVPRWLVFPLVFAVYTLFRGAWSGFYPYPFINAAKLGYARVGANCLYLLGVMTVLGLLFTAVDRWVGRRQHTASLENDRV